MQIPFRSGPIDLARQVIRVTASTAREQGALLRAIHRMPTPVPWDWAAPRLIPLLSGPRFDEPGMPLVRLASDLGPAVEFGLDLGGVFALVDQAVADRWECSANQLMARGMVNLRERAARIDADRVITGVVSGRSIRLLRDRPAWASSVLLDTASTTRLFGSHDQALAAPQRGIVVSVPIDTSEPVAAEIVIELEGSSLTSLFLDPFFLEDGVLRWVGNAMGEMEDDAWD